MDLSGVYMSFGRGIARAVAVWPGEASNMPLGHHLAKNLRPEPLFVGKDSPRVVLGAASAKVVSGKNQPHVYSTISSLTMVRASDTDGVCGNKHCQS